MIDNLSILLSHALLLIMLWRLLGRDDLDREAPAEEVRAAAREAKGDSDDESADTGWLHRPSATNSRNASYSTKAMKSKWGRKGDA